MSDSVFPGGANLWACWYPNGPNRRPFYQVFRDRKPGLFPGDDWALYTYDWTLVRVETSTPWREEQIGVYATLDEASDAAKYDWSVEAGLGAFSPARENSTASGRYRSKQRPLPLLPAPWQVIPSNKLPRGVRGAWVRLVGVAVGRRTTGEARYTLQLRADGLYHLRYVGAADRDGYREGQKFLGTFRSLGEALDEVDVSLAFADFFPRRESS